MESNRPHFVRDQRELPAIRALFDLQQRLPYLPFVGIRGSCWIFDFDDILSSRFVDRLGELARAYGDREVEVLAADENAESWFAEFGVLPAFVAEANSISQDYLDGLWTSPTGSPNMALVQAGDVFAVAGSSRGWALWAQRDWEIGVLLTSGDRRLEISEEAPFVLPEDDFEMWRGPAGWSLEIAPTMLAEFRDQIRAAAR